MNSFYIKLVQCFIVFFLFNGLYAQVPEGGIQLNATTGTTYTRIGVGTLTPIAVTDQPFTTGFRLEVGTNVNNAWDSQVKFPAVAGIEVNDIVLVAFYARTTASVQETGEGKLTVTIENNTTYAKDLYLTVTIGREWKQYYAPVKCISTLATNQVSYAFHTGYRSQTLEIADVKFLNYKQTLTLDDLPQTEINYFGREADAEWRAPADERINQIRKGIAEIMVYDEQGQVVENANVSIEMVRHQFGFGSAIPADRFMTNAIFREKVYELFNEVVFENDLKWHNLTTSPSLNVRRTLDSLDKHNIEVRGHNIIWPAWRWLPTALRTNENNPQALRLQIEKRIDEASQFAKGRLNDWDVINEPYSEHDIMDILGPEVMADWFKRVRQNDRDVKLYLNDYAILSGGGINEKKHDYYYNLVQYIDSLGGGVDGIGFQGHFGSDLTPIPKLYTILDRFAELGKDIKITEHDINITQREVQADYTRDFLTIMYSHESVKSVLFWGFWENSHWMPDAALYNADWTIRPHGEVYSELVFNKWWTPKTDSLTNNEGIATFEGFLGTYKFTVTDGENERTGTFTLDHSNKSEIPNIIKISLDESVPVQVSITAKGSAVLCEGETVTLRAPKAEGLTYKWHLGEELLAEATADTLVTGAAGFYMLRVSKGSVETTSPAFEVVVNPYPEAIISVDGEVAFCPGGKAVLNANIDNDASYTWMKGTTKIQGSVTSIDATTSGTYRLITNAKGCSTTSEPADIQVYAADAAECTVGIDEILNGFRVYPNPFKGSFILETNYSANVLTAELYNAVGELVFRSDIDPSQAQKVIPVSAPGFYTLKVRGAGAVKSFKIIGL
jgi:endo-1,4-beta-xylanase